MVPCERVRHVVLTDCVQHLTRILVTLPRCGCSRSVWREKALLLSVAHNSWTQKYRKSISDLYSLKYGRQSADSLKWHRIGHAASIFYCVCVQGGRTVSFRSKQIGQVWLAGSSRSVEAFIAQEAPVSWDCTNRGLMSADFVACRWENWPCSERPRVMNTNERLRQYEAALQWKHDPVALLQLLVLKLRRARCPSSQQDAPLH